MTGTWGRGQATGGGCSGVGGRWGLQQGGGVHDWCRGGLTGRGGEFRRQGGDDWGRGYYAGTGGRVCRV